MKTNNNGSLPRNTVRGGFFYTMLSHSDCIHISRALELYLADNPELLHIDNLANLFHTGGIAAAYSLASPPSVVDEAQNLLIDLGINV